ncbi:hypothetical protein BV20DRAFT_962772 [Pilatotrama ljubarskyi]|nr:hypothetical protein BV20DRAFT_962755 [Pilatotrama ljubarskyi]KAI0373569.1 hypothetical protein BV20DRAFT_962772 [Pilatotrama ljubarskyi]
MTGARARRQRRHGHRPPASDERVCGACWLGRYPFRPRSTPDVRGWLMLPVPNATYP